MVNTDINFVGLALRQLRPDAFWGMSGTTYESIMWSDESHTKPSEQEVETEVYRLQQEHNNTQYQRKRASEYPPITDYLDGVVKGDQSQIDNYIAMCQAIKAKYPKP